MKLTPCRSRHPFAPMRRPLALAVALTFGPIALAAPAVVLPTGGSIASGNATIGVNGSTMNVQQTSANAIINWGSFSISNGATVSFQQPSATSITLNRVTGTTASVIDGALNANGRVFLVNPNGMLFSGTAQVNVGGLVASALDIPDSTFLADVGSNKFVFGGAATTTTTATVTNAGSITVAPGGNVALLGANDNAVNSGTITASQGKIAMGTGGLITLDLQGDGLTQIVINQTSIKQSQVINSGTLIADGGQVVLVNANGSITANGNSLGISDTGLIQARSLVNQRGEIILKATNGADVEVNGGTIDAGSFGIGQEGGFIDIEGNNVGILNGAKIVATSDFAGGSMAIVSGNGGVLAFDAASSIDASGVNNGAGGSISLVPYTGIRAFGPISARGGANGGVGGQVQIGNETTTNYDLSGVRIDTSSPTSTDGRWYFFASNDLSIVHGAANGSMPANPYAAVTSSSLQDADINYALNAGSNINVYTRGRGTQPGEINFNGNSGSGNVVINRSTGTQPLSFTLHSNADIAGNNFSIGSTSGPLSLQFDGNTAGANPNNGGISLQAGSLQTNGGYIWMYGQGDPGNGYASSGQIGINLQGMAVDTRVGQSDANSGGDFFMRGQAPDLGNNQPGNPFGIFLGGGSSVHTASGNIIWRGIASSSAQGFIPISTGVALGGSSTQSITTTVGSINIVGIAKGDSIPTSGGGATQGIGIENSTTIQSDRGLITLSGYSDNNGNGHPTVGFNLDGTIRSNGGIQLTGVSANGGYGLNIGGDGTTGATNSLIDGGNGPVVLRAGNNASADAIVIAGKVQSTGIVDLRPGTMDANGTSSDSVNDVITIGAGNGFALSAAELGQISTPNLVLGSDTQAGAIAINDALTRSGNLTLQNTGGTGGITLNAAVNLGANTLAMMSGGNISQTAAGAITAQNLLLHSAGGSVALAMANNNVTTMAGDATSAFTYDNGGALGVSQVNATGVSTAANTPLALSGIGVASGNDVLVRTLSGDLTLNANISGNTVNLLSAGTLQNPNDATITAVNHWWVWANTWIGENRGGLAGSGNLPNLYNCGWGACHVTPSATDNHFLYTQQPTLTLTADNVTREYGLANPALNFEYTDGLVLGDQLANILAGGVTTTATIGSQVGSYAIGNNFSSPAGYAIQVVPGTFAITQATLTYTANTASRIYGDPNGVFTGTVTGFRNNDSLQSATTGAMSFSSPANARSDVGSYAIDGSGLSAQNYRFVNAASNTQALNITPATLTYVANAASRVYGDSNNVFSGTVAGFRNDDTMQSATTGTLSFTSSANQQSNVGQYAINGAGLSARNYMFAPASSNTQALSITPATLSYVADAVSRVYGDANPMFTGTVTGFRNNDTMQSATTGTLSFASTASQSSNVGKYAIDGSGLSARNYVFAPVIGNNQALSITPATLTYLADNASRVYGDPNGAFNGTVTGFRNNDTLQSATTGTLSFTSAANQQSNVGHYAIEGSGLSAQNYIFAPASGNALALSITPATLTYVADAASRVYGDPNGAFGGTVVGFRNNDTQQSATTGSLSFTSAANQQSNVGNYAINGSGLSAQNYLFAPAPSNAQALTVTPATLTYVSNPATRVAGQPIDEYSGTVTGFRNNDTLASSTTGTQRYYSPTNQYTPVGSYGIFGEGLQANNYNFVQANGDKVALNILPPAQNYLPAVVLEKPETYVYDRNFGIVNLCPAMDLASDARDKDGDVLAREWARVRSRPNLANCVTTKQKSSCGDF